MSSARLIVLRHLDDVMAYGQDSARITPALAKLVLVSLLATSGCSTIFNGTGRDVSFTSNVRGAEIYVEGKYVGKTPIIARVGHGRHRLAEARKPGYVPERAILTSFNGNLLWLLVVPCLVVPFIIDAPIDALTGAMFPVDESSVRFDLARLPSPAEVQRPPGGTVRESSGF
jgi:PEGA domain